MSATARPSKLVLAVIDGARPDMLERAVAEGRAPILSRLMSEGLYVDSLTASFPSVTPVCTATIITGTGPDQHLVPSMNWYHRGEQRYVEYGSSFQASRTIGIKRSLIDLVYNLNLSHLSRDTPTLFETLDDADVRTAGTTFLMYRGRYRHEPSGEGVLGRFATSTLMRHAVYGPRELFYADLFASRETGCRSQLGLPGVRDAAAGCVAAYLTEHDLFDFLLLSLPDTDTASHKGGPEAQIDAIAGADKQLARMMAAAGGPDAFLSEHAVIVVSDHAHTLVDRTVALLDALSDWRVLKPSDAQPQQAQIAVCPAQRSAMIYVLDEEQRELIASAVAERLVQLRGVDLVARELGGEVSVCGHGGELRFAPGGDLTDLGGRRWSVEGDLGALQARTPDRRFVSDNYPDALFRLWSAATSATTGDVLLSASPGYEFVDWGGVDHSGAGSHGSLHRDDSLGILVAHGAGPSPSQDRMQWTLRDIEPIVREHFGLVEGSARAKAG
ncbi:MAG: alkaline phosphatase family protein [Actinomycetota bacterium]